MLCFFCFSPGYPRLFSVEKKQVRGWWNTQIVPKTEEEVAKMREAGQLAHRALDLAETLIVPGVTTEEMDKELHTFMCAMVKFNPTQPVSSAHGPWTCIYCLFKMGIWVVATQIFFNFNP